MVIKWRRIGFAGHVAHKGEMNNMHAVLLEKSERNSSLRTLGCRWEDITKMDRK